MKTILALLLAVTVAHAGEPSYAFQQLKKSMATVQSERGPGPCPMVTSDTLPSFIQSALRERMKDPNSMEFIGWTSPEIRSTRTSGNASAWWHMEVKVRAKNSYGGYVVSNYGLMIERERVTRVARIP